MAWAIEVYLPAFCGQSINIYVKKKEKSLAFIGVKNPFQRHFLL